VRHAGTERAVSSAHSGPCFRPCEASHVLKFACNRQLTRCVHQERARKLRIFPDEEHPFVGDPRLVAWEMPPRKLRVKEGLFEVPEGFEPLNADAYRKRYGHMLPKDVVERLREGTGEAVVPAVAQA
jgi:hypothetical protein